MKMLIDAMVSVLLIIVFIAEAKGKITNFSLKAATRFKDVESYYLKMRKEELLALDLKAWNKGSLCKSFLESSYFASRLEKYVEPNTRATTRELWKYRRSILEDHYVLREPAKRVKMGTGNFDYIYEDKYEIQKVKVGHTRLSELVYMCLARDVRTQAIKQYFISRPYPLDMDDDKHFNVAFLFVYNRRNELVVDAIIDEAAVDDVVPYRWKRLHLENEYLLFIEETPQNKAGANSAVCQLSDNEKLRLCTSIMNMQNYRPALKLWPGKLNIEYTCQERQLDFWHTQEKHYYEWTLGCRARNKHSGTRTTIYIAQDCRSDNTSVLVFLGLRGKLVTAGTSKCVTVLLDHKWV